MAWAEQEFGDAELGDARRTRRLVLLAADAARRPSGVVSKACSTSASREGAFRLLENGHVRPEAVASAIHKRTVQRCRGGGIVFVAVDGSSLTVDDDSGSKGLGGVGAWSSGARGVQAMTALALSVDGAPVGVCGQRMWIRGNPSEVSAETSRKESRYWLDLLGETHALFSEQAPGVRPWFQMDRGADYCPVFMLASAVDALLTVRAAHNRALVGGGRLWTKLQRAPLLARRRIEVPARPPGRRKKRVNGKRIVVLTAPRRARTATVSIRATRVALLGSLRSAPGEIIEINAVFVQEESRSGERLEWMLLTTHPIRTRRDVLAVVDGYALRWRIEDFHRVWKRGLCRVEDTQLRSRAAICKWATILAAVATRAMRLTHLARQTPDVPATTEFSQTELNAITALRQPKDVDEHAVPTLAQAVRWVADIGGYTGPWNGPPGATVIGRGLYDVLVTARAFEYRDKKR